MDFNGDAMRSMKQNSSSAPNSVVVNSAAVNAEPVNAEAVKSPLRVRGRIGRLLKRIVLVLLTLYVVVIIQLMIAENALVYPAPEYPVGNWNQSLVAVEDVEFKSLDGTPLHGWFVACPDARATILYFHGNGENVGQQAHLLKELRDRFQVNVFAFDYRGYGKSAGSPTEQGIQLDARAALVWLNERTGTQPAEILFFGRSIGAAIAIELAADKGCKGLVLQSAFSSLPDATAVHYPWAPVAWLMRNRYPSQELIGNCRQPVLQTHGTADRIIPLACGQKLFNAVISKHKRFVALPGAGHNGYPSTEFWIALSEFLDVIAPANPVAAPLHESAGADDDSESNNPAWKRVHQ
jgi:fermentation-respiration switch protein FrsA (DUF1100 family)